MHALRERKQKKGLLKMHIESVHMGILHTSEMFGNTYKTKDTFRNHEMSRYLQQSSMTNKFNY